MVEEVALRVGIDARPAKDGANEFKRSADDIIRTAEKTRRFVEKLRGSSKELAQETKKHSNAFELAVRTTVRAGEFNMAGAGTIGGNQTNGSMVQNAASSHGSGGSGEKKYDNNERVREALRNAIIDRLTRENKSFDDRPFDLTVLNRDPVEFLFLEPVSKAVEKIKQEAKREREFKEREELAEQLRREAKQLLNTGDRTGAEIRNERAAQLLEKNLPIRRDKLSELYAIFEQQVEQIGRTFGPAVQDSPLSAHPELPFRYFRDFQEALRTNLEQIEALEKEVVERADEISLLRNGFPEAGPSVDDGPIPSPDDLSPQSAVDDAQLNEQLDEASRRFEQLQELNKALADSIVAAVAQQEKQIDLLQREKECLDRLNEALRENATLRAGAGGRSDGVSESEAAHEDLTKAIDANGAAIRQLQEDVDRLNAALAEHAAINGQVTEGLNKERDAHRQVNGEIAERRRLEEAQKERLIKEEDDAKRRAAAVEASIEQIRGAAKDAFADVIKGTESVGDAFKKLADRITDILLDLALEELLKGGTGFSDLFGAIFGGLGGIFGGASSLSGAATSAASLSRASAAGAFTTYRPTGGAFGFHTGGIVGIDGTPRLTAANFNGAPRYHGGGIIGLDPMTGLAADEVPIIAQRGEEVLTRRDPRHRDSLGAGGGNVVVNVSFPNARNTDEARQAGSEIAAKAA